MGKIFIINDDGSKREVLNIQELQELARQGAVLPETKIEAKGRVVNAGKIKELTGVFIATRIRTPLKRLKSWGAGRQPIRRCRLLQTLRLRGPYTPGKW